MIAGSVGAAILAAREARGWSQGALAEAMGCSRPAVGLLETGKRGLSPRMALKLAAAFGGDATDWQRLDLDRVLALPPMRRASRADVANRAERRTKAPPDVAAARVVAAARAVFRSARIDGEGAALSVEVDGKALWELGTALDKEGER